MGSGPTGALGESAEQQALRFLARQGLKTVAKNFRCRGGEIDLIMLDADCLAFVEVRYRKSTRYCSPAPTVDARKQRKILRTAATFLSRQKRYRHHTVRFDVVAIAGDSKKRLDWIKDAFRPNDSTL